MRRSFLRSSSFLVCSLLAFGALACETSIDPVTTESGVSAVFDTDGAFFDTPWPSDLRLDPNGHPIMTGFPNPGRNQVVMSFIDTVESDVAGFSVSSPIYFRFDGELSELSLPQSAAESLTDASSAFLIDIDSASPNHLVRHPSRTVFWDMETTYWPGHTLAIRPVHGIPLRGQTTYAAVLTNALAGVDGIAVKRPHGVSVLLGLEPPLNAEETADFEAYAVARDALLEAGIALDSIVSLTAFTTQDPVGEMVTIRDYIDAMPTPELVPRSTRSIRAEDGYTLVTGEYRSPMFMEGEVPFQAEGGAIRFDASGDPILQGEFDQRFAVTIPVGEMPTSGWPLILYAHGTGGDYESFVGETAARAAAVGFAMMGTDQIHHGPRNPTTAGAEGLVFNVTNPQALRNNTRQAAADLMAQARFAANTPVDARAVGPGVFFDADQMYFFGHSQGGLNGPLFLATDDTVLGGILSGAGGQVAIALVEKVEPIRFSTLVALVLGVANEETEHLVYEHPAFAALGTLVDVSDPTNYGHLIVPEPLPGYAPKHILMTQGIEDEFTPPRSMAALATAMRLPRLSPGLEVLHSADVVMTPDVTAPVQANLGGATGALVQYSGGHYVVFTDAARDQVQTFFETALTGAPVIQ